MRHRFAAAIALGTMALCTFAAAQEPRSQATVPEPGTYVHLMVFEDIGDSLRFNNPYRLSNQLGSTGESLSRTPVYNSLGGAVTLGDPNGLQHGMALQWSRSLSGLPQHVVTPSYMVLLARWRPWLPYARLGLPVILNPDANVGGEAAVGATYLLLAGVGVHAEMVGNVFYGAATWTTGRTTIPMLSLQAGLTIDYEVLP
ncbi:MAG: hypothetical protein HY898_04385 [Deltaproteobacteria bacterium]|nr:hypothetical protein [Deltaproteobacteria bacterium]